MVVSVFNAEFSYREKSGRIFRGHPKRHAFGKRYWPSAFNFDRLGLVVVIE